MVLIGQDAFRNCTNGQYANRSSSVGWSQYGTISTITHTTGGKTSFEYENNYARNYALPIGGSRISKITFEDLISKLKTVKKYQYLQADGTSSGFLCLKPVYHFDSQKMKILNLSEQPPLFKRYVIRYFYWSYW